MKIFFSVIGGLFVLTMAACTYQIGTERAIEVGAKGYYGRYEVGGLELQYHIPRRLIGPQVFTDALDQFHDASDLRIFVSSFAVGNGGISLGLCPFPVRLTATHELSDYTEFYQHHAKERGLNAKVSEEVISGITWMRIEEHYKNGLLARVLYVQPILPDYMLVCRIGLNDDIDPEAKSTRWTEWMPAISEVMNNFRVSRK